MNVDELAEALGINLVMDGNMWCAQCPDFVNLQESEAGFGETKLAALEALAADRPDLDIFHSHSLECSPHCRRMDSACIVAASEGK
jgi:hypothetical protein